MLVPPSDPNGALVGHQKCSPSINFRVIQFIQVPFLSKQSLDFCKSYFCTGCHTCVLTKLPVIQLMISNTFLVRLMQQLFLSKHLIIKFYILCVISVKCTVWILKLLLNPMIILIIVSESTIECSSIILFVMVGVN